SLPHRHLFAQVRLNLLRHLLKESAGSAAASWTSGDLRSEAANSERLQNLLCDAHFLAAIAAGRGSKRDADSVADTFLQKHAQGGARSDNTFWSHTSFGQSQMQRVIAAHGQRAIDVNQILHAAHLRAQNNLLGTQAVLFRQPRRSQRAYYHGFHCDFAGIFRIGQARVLVHHAREQCLIERSPVDADANWLLIFDCDFDHGAEIGIVFSAYADISWIDSILG